MTIPQPPGFQAVPGVPGRGAGFWILVIGGCLGLAVVVLLGGAVLLGILAATSDEAVAPAAATGAGKTGGSAEIASPAASEPDDFLFKGRNGLEYIAENHVVAEGVSVTLAGEWREDHRSVVLRLREGGRYQLAVGGGAIAGSKYDMVASTSSELGTWAFDGNTLTLTPDQLDLTGIGEGKQNSDKGRADGPRRWNVVGVTIEYRPEGSTAPKQRPGLRINGPSPSWYYPQGNWDYVLRSVR